jgi:hypothetical protein
MALALQTSSNITPNQSKQLLNLWPDVVLENSWLFNQCAGLGAPIQTNGDKGKVYLQKEREYIARHLEQAADRMAADLNYHIRPMYFSEEIPLGSGRPFYNQLLQARWLKMIALGTRATSLIEAGVAVTYSDPNNTGVDDTATITVNTTIANGEIQLYFQVADGAPDAGNYRYQIEPIQVQSSGGVATITAPRWLFVKPTEWARQYQLNDPNFNSPNIMDTGTAAGFVTAVDVYRVYTDTTAPVELRSASGELIRTYTGEIIDYELSTFKLGYECSADYCGDRPVNVRVNYYAGSPLVNGYIDNELYEACVAFASARMPTQMTGMSFWSLENYRRWNEPMVRTVGSVTIPIATDRQSKSGYGALYGEVLAWEVAMARGIMKAGKLTLGRRW